MSSARSLFDFEKTAIRTDVAGYSHAIYAQYTQVSRHIYGQLFKIFEFHKLDFYLFAGTVVGYLRNGRPPYWMDDIDIIIFEDQIDHFEETVIPHLKSCGFNCFTPNRFEGGGWHILSMQQGNTRSLTIPLTDNLGVPVPWAQVDVFFTMVDRDGFIRNPAGWGLYDRKNIPVSWVRPGVRVEMESWQVQLFAEYSEDIKKEYGDVMNNVVVSTHDKVFLKAPNITWDVFESDFNRIVSETASEFPPSVNTESLKAFSPKQGSVFNPNHGQSFDSIISSLLRLQADQLSIFDEDHIFWVMDIKRLLPQVRVCVHLIGVKSAQRAAHLREFIDFVTAETQELDDTYRGYIKSLSLMSV